MRKRKFLPGNRKITEVIASALPALFGCLSGIYSRAVTGVKRVDSEGYLYQIGYKGDYRRKVIAKPITLVRGGGCSAFMTRDPEGHILTGRNYDLPHRDREGNTTGLNAVMELSPTDGYRSLNFADAAWIAYLGIPYRAGCLDDGKTTHLPLAILPYLCMDGINEKGLTVSILAMDVKEGESPVYQHEEGKRSLMITEILREMLDTCATAEEAVRLAEGINAVNMLGNDYHLFVTDEKGVSAVIEWRYDRLFVTYTDAVTNFYVSSDDACDSYVGEKLRERFVPPGETKRHYRCGYGHGYGRFAGLAEKLDACIRDLEKLTTEMTEKDAMDLLKKVSQEYIPGNLTSMTQYSAVYDNTARSVRVCVMRDYERSYTFRLSETEKDSGGNDR